MAKGFKTGGRTIGTPNKTTKEIRSLLSGVLSNEIEKIPQYMEEIDPEKKLQILVKLLPYIMPVYDGKFESEQEVNHDTKAFIQQINQSIIESKSY